MHLPKLAMLLLSIFLFPWFIFFLDAKVPLQLRWMCYKASQLVPDLRPSCICALKPNHAWQKSCCWWIHQYWGKYNMCLPLYCFILGIKSWRWKILWNLLAATVKNSSWTALGWKFCANVCFPCQGVKSFLRKGSYLSITIDFKKEARKRKRTSWNQHLPS